MTLVPGSGLLKRIETPEGRFSLRPEVGRVAEDIEQLLSRLAVEPGVVGQLLEHDEYRAKLVARWRQLREPGALFSDTRISAMIQENFEILRDGPATRNFSRWKVIGRPIFPLFFFTVLPIYETWEEEVWRSEGFLLERARWIDAHIEQVGE